MSHVTENSEMSHVTENIIINVTYNRKWSEMSHVTENSEMSHVTENMVRNVTCNRKHYVSLNTMCHKTLVCVRNFNERKC